jgi:capsular exopolysaccharide synthesis family protein
MGKIFNALEKYRSERNALAESSEPLQPADWDALMQYNRHTGKLNIKARSIIRDPGSIQRLIAHQLILEDGRVTEAGKLKFEELSYRLRVDLAGRPEPRSAPPPEPEIDAAEPNRPPAPLKKEPAETLLVSVQPRGDAAAESPSKAAAAGDDEFIEAYASDSAPPRPAEKAVKKPAVPDRGATAAISPNLVSLLTPQSFESEQFKILRTNLLFPPSGKPPRSVLITSVEPEDGKSFVAANLAVSVAININRYVLLVDADLRRPTIHKQFGFGDGPGLSEYLAKEAALPSLLLQTKVDRLTILPGGAPPENPSELLSSERMSSLLKEITERYSDRLIIIDSPPPMLTAETGVLARRAEGIILVIRYTKTSRSELKKLIEHLGKEKIIGCVMNYFDYQSAGPYGYREYGNYKGYKQYR